MKPGIVGLPNVGRSTLSSSLTKTGAQATNYPFCITGPNVGMVAVLDTRTKALGGIHYSKRVTPAVAELVDITGLVRGANRGEGFSNQFLANIHEYDATIYMIRCFEDENAIHMDDSVDSVRDIETINLELIFAGLEVLGRRVAKTQKSANSDKSSKKELEILEELEVLLEDGKLASAFEADDADVATFVASLCLLTAEPVIYTANVERGDFADDGASNPHVVVVRACAATYQSRASCVSAQTEEETVVFDKSEKADCLEALGISVSGLDKLTAMSYELLDLIGFLTAGEDETHAQTIKKGSKAPQAAGKIHIDFERGFVRAEVIGYSDFVRCGSSAMAKGKGFTCLEDKDYVVQNGDVIPFRFNI